jgi:hypothetical protein
MPPRGPRRYQSPQESNVNGEGGAEDEVTLAVRAGASGQPLGDYAVENLRGIVETDHAELVAELREREFLQALQVVVQQGPPRKGEAAVAHERPFADPGGSVRRIDNLADPYGRRSVEPEIAPCKPERSVAERRCEDDDEGTGGKDESLAVGRLAGEHEAKREGLAIHPATVDPAPAADPTLAAAPPTGDRQGGDLLAGKVQDADRAAAGLTGEVDRDS